MDKDEIKETLEKHADRIENLEKEAIRANVQIDNLCKKLDELMDSFKSWGQNLTVTFIGGAVAGIIALILFVIEKHI